MSQLNAEPMPLPTTLAGASILFEIGQGYGVFDNLRKPGGISAEELAESSGLATNLMSHYLGALESAGLMERDGDKNHPNRFRPAPSFNQVLNGVGYITWGLRACYPLIENAHKFATDFPTAIDKYPRSGDVIARTSRWAGERGFYPQAESTILGLKPRRFVDLGAGAAGLLIRCLKQLPNDTTGVAIDMSSEACDLAHKAINAAGMQDRIQVIQAPIQSLASDPSPLAGADVVHAGFVLHDLMPQDEAALDAVLRHSHTAMGDRGQFLAVEAVPYATDESERAFSAAFTFLHEAFMGLRLQPEEEWTERLKRAGFNHVAIQRLGIPGGRLFAASN